MLRVFRKFIRKYVIDHSKFLTELNDKRHERIAQVVYKRRQKMTYAQIEQEVGETYETIFGRKINWDNPQTYNEKINVSKIYMPSPLKTRLADKYLVREWIREKIGEKYLIPLYGVYDSFDEIDFDSLPEKFVIKCNHDSGSVTLIHDKSTLNLPALKKKYDTCMKRNYAWSSFEMHYRDIKPKIVIEKYMKNATNNYEFLCIEGRPLICWIDFDHLKDRRRNVYDMNWNLMSFNISKCKNYSAEIPRPEVFESMKKLAAKLSQCFNMVRVDFYFVDKKIYFNEMTFTSGSGFSLITPDEWDYKLGELWPFDNEARKKILAKHSRPDFDFSEIL